MNYNILSWIGVLMISSNFLSRVVCTHDPHGDVGVGRATLPNYCSIQEVDPHDMGSYSHPAKCNNPGHRDQQGDIEETVVKRAVYRTGQEGRPTPSIIHKQIPNGQQRIASLTSGEKEEEEDGVVEVVSDGKDYVQLTETTTKYRKGECVCPTMDQTPVMIYMRQIIGSLLDQMGVRVSGIEF